MATINLKKCPFCGGNAGMMEKKIYLDRGFTATCSGCGVHGRVVLVNHPQMTASGLDESTRYTAAQAEQKAAELWNARATVND